MRKKRLGAQPNLNGAEAVNSGLFTRRAKVMRRGLVGRWRGWFLNCRYRARNGRRTTMRVMRERDRQVVAAEKRVPASKRRKE
jgi:hypothetical protein